MDGWKTGMIEDRVSKIEGTESVWEQSGLLCCVYKDQCAVQPSTILCTTSLHHNGEIMSVNSF